MSTTSLRYPGKTADPDRIHFARLYGLGSIFRAEVSPFWSVQRVSICRHRGAPARVAGTLGPERIGTSAAAALVDRNLACFADLEFGDRLVKFGLLSMRFSDRIDC